MAFDSIMASNRKMTGIESAIYFLRGLGRARSPSAPQRTARRSVPTITREIGSRVREKTARYRVHGDKSKFKKSLNGEHPRYTAPD